jgi:hypothetical protein
VGLQAGSNDGAGHKDRGGFSGSGEVVEDAVVGLSVELKSTDGVRNSKGSGKIGPDECQFGQ